MYILSKILDSLNIVLLSSLLAVFLARKIFKNNS